MLFSVDPEKCQHDGLCVMACGRRLIHMEDPEALPLPIDGAKEMCIDCGHCVAACPTGALSLQTMSSDDCPEIQKDLHISFEQAEQLFRSRRSIRAYKDKPVSRDTLNRLIEIAGYAPSAHNDHPVHLTVIEGSAEVNRMSGLVIDWMRHTIQANPALAEMYQFSRIVEFWEMGKDPVCRNAPALVIAHADKNLAMANIDAVIALSHIELAVPPLGLGATWAGYVMAAINYYPPMAEALALPEGNSSHGALMIGYPKLKFTRIPLRKPPAVTWRTV
jgi:nitroreductase/NAD-dependent dihydropyrimidine dehydrogenase PreA subunit